jgi:hypothetical protein
MTYLATPKTPRFNKKVTFAVDRSHGRVTEKERGEGAQQKELHQDLQLDVAM